MISGDVQVRQNGLVPSARQLTNAVALDIAMVDGNGDQLTGFDPSKPATAAITSVGISVTSVVLHAADPLRKGIVIVNDTSKELSIAFAATASLAAYTVRLPGKGTYEGPLNGYTGVISGIWNNAGGGGNAIITQLV